MRLALLLPGSLSPFNCQALEPVLADPAITVAAAVVDRRRPRRLVEKIRRARRSGRGGFVLVMAVHAARRPAGIDARAYLDERRVPVHETTDLYAADTVEFLRGSRPDALFRAGFGVVREPILSLAPHGVLSYHHGDLRRFRGLPPAFWELYRGEREMGVTLQVLAPELDAGPVVAEARVPVEAADSWGSLHDRAYARSVGLLHQGCRALDSPGFAPRPVDRLGPLYTTPTLRQWSKLQLRVALRRLRPGAHRREQQCSHS